MLTWLDNKLHWEKDAYGKDLIPKTPVLFTQRLNKDEVNLYRTLSHLLTPNQREEKRQFMQRQIRIDLRWGFIGSRRVGVFGQLRRICYRFFIHPFLKKNPGW